MKRIAVVGPGKVGTAMAFLLKQKGHEILGFAGHNTESTHRAAEALAVSGVAEPEELTRAAEIILITTPDRAIEDVCKQIQEKQGFHGGQVVIHMSGALPAEVLSPAKEAGALILSLHPLQSFADVEQAIKNLTGSFFSIEGDEQAVPVGIGLVQNLGGRYFRIDSDKKPLYHAGAAIASNFLVATLHWAIRSFEQLGISEEEAICALWPLIQGSLNNVKSLGPARALTGPISRGDITTVNKHLEVIRASQEENELLYRVQGAYTAKVALEKGSVDRSAFEKMTEILKGGC